MTVRRPSSRVIAPVWRMVQGCAHDDLRSVERAPPDSPGLEELRTGCPVARTPAGPWYLARHDDVLAATKDVDLFQASFREPGVVVPDEEQLINEIPEPRHGKIRRIINSAIAQHRIGRTSSRSARELCNELLDDLLAARRAGRPRAPTT